MKHIRIIFFKIQLLTIILCDMIATGLCGSLFGFDPLPPVKDIDTGFDKISQPVMKQNKNEKKANDPFGSFDPFSSKDNVFKPDLLTPRPPVVFGDSFKAPPVFKPKKDEKKVNDPFNSFDPFFSKDNLFKPNLSTPTSPAPVDIVDNLKTIPELPLGFINKLAKDEKNSSKNAPVKLDSRGSFGSDHDSPASKSTERTTKKTVSEGTGDSLVTLAWQDIGTDYTTETSEYETTTDDEMSHVGGPAPAVVASLLG